MLSGESRGVAVLAALAPRGRRKRRSNSRGQRHPVTPVRPSTSPLRLTSQNSHDHMLTSSILGPQEKEKEVPLHGL